MVLDCVGFWALERLRMRAFARVFVTGEAPGSEAESGERGYALADCSHLCQLAVPLAQLPCQRLQILNVLKQHCSARTRSCLQHWWRECRACAFDQVAAGAARLALCPPPCKAPAPRPACQRVRTPAPVPHRRLDCAQRWRRRLWWVSAARGQARRDGQRSCTAAAVAHFAIYSPRRAGDHALLGQQPRRECGH